MAVPMPIPRPEHRAAQYVNRYFIKFYELYGQIQCDRHWAEMGKSYPVSDHRTGSYYPIYPASGLLGASGRPRPENPAANAVGAHAKPYGSAATWTCCLVMICFRFAKHPAIDPAAFEMDPDPMTSWFSSRSGSTRR